MTDLFSKISLLASNALTFALSVTPDWSIAWSVAGVVVTLVFGVVTVVQSRDSADSTRRWVRRWERTERIKAIALEHLGRGDQFGLRGDPAGVPIAVTLSRLVPVTAVFSRPPKLHWWNPRSWV